jgi:plasmid stabilization system protein ParE
VKQVRVADAAYRDLSRLAAWLAPKSPRAADLAAEALTQAVASLSELPDRGRPLQHGVRELAVEFGRDGYIVRYRTSETWVTVTRIFYGRERR